MCQNWPTPLSFQVPLLSTMVASGVSGAFTSTTRAPAYAGTPLTGVCAVTTLSVAVNRAKLFAVRSWVWIVPFLMSAEVICLAATAEPAPATAATRTTPETTAAGVRTRFLRFIVASSDVDGDRSAPDAHGDVLTPLLTDLSGEGLGAL